MTLIKNSTVENSAIEIRQIVESNAQNSSLSRMKKKRTTNPGIRYKGSRIYDSENGKSCHQCRQKTRDLVAFCKPLKRDKLCTLAFCKNCLKNRYGEDVDEVIKFANWICPKCRDICNCSFCMKRKGLQPTGILVRNANVNGFNSVRELLDNKSVEISKSLIADSTASHKKLCISDKGGSPTSKRTRDQENQYVKQSDGEPLQKVRKSVQLAVLDRGEPRRENIALPLGSPLEEVAGTLSSQEGQEHSVRVGNYLEIQYPSEHLIRPRIVWILIVCAWRDCLTGWILYLQINSCARKKLQQFQASAHSRNQTREFFCSQVCSQQSQHDLSHPFHVMDGSDRAVTTVSKLAVSKKSLIKLLS